MNSEQQQELHHYEDVTKRSGSSERLEVNYQQGQNYQAHVTEVAQW